MYELNGEVFHDDRMFLLHVCKVTVERAGDQRCITIHHEQAPEDHDWGVVYYKNSGSYPAHKTDFFETEEEALEFYHKVAPQCPRVSLGGRGAGPAFTFQLYSAWLHENGWHEYDYKAIFGGEGKNAKERLYQQL